MFTCSDDEFQPATASFIASRQLQMKANNHPTDIPLHNTSSVENPHFVKKNNTGTMAVEQVIFPLVSDEEMVADFIFLTVVCLTQTT